ncbi:hypothetical protein [Lonepinella sp. BR2882]|uniref:hypothetical protein n=1 Tax=Lonepinella sp. BR2882 TaxID=3095283 RepID=UPI003F6E0712
MKNYQISAERLATLEKYAEALIYAFEFKKPIKALLMKGYEMTILWRFVHEKQAAGRLNALKSTVENSGKMEVINE